MDVLDELEDLGVVPVVVIDDADRAGPLGEALLAGGLPCAEITFRTAAAGPAIEALTRSFPEMLVGAGTVLTVEQAEVAVSTGSRFIVSPALDEDLVSWCMTNKVPVIPGVMTPTEVAAAMSHELNLLKFFPAGAGGGVRMLESLGSVFPGVSFMPTGGISAGNLADYLRLPMVAACGGSWLAPKESIAGGDFGRIEQLTAEAMAIVREVRTGD